MNDRQRAVEFMGVFKNSDPIALLAAYGRAESMRALEEVAAIIDPDGDLCSMQEEGWRAWSRDWIRSVIERKRKEI